MAGVSIAKVPVVSVIATECQLKCRQTIDLQQREEDQRLQRVGTPAEMFEKKNIHIRVFISTLQLDGDDRI